MSKATELLEKKVININRQIMLTLAESEIILAELRQQPTIESIEVPKGFLLIKSNSFMGKIAEFEKQHQPCETCRGSRKVPMRCVECPVVEKDQCMKICPTKPCLDCQQPPAGELAEIGQGYASDVFRILRHGRDCGCPHCGLLLWVDQACALLDQLQTNFDNLVKINNENIDRIEQLQAKIDQLETERKNLIN